MFDLSGKVALVTGGSRGLGRADCLALAGAGADVVVTDILIESDPGLQEAAEASGSVLAQVMTSQNAVYSERTSNEIRAMGRRSAAVKMDVTNRDQVKAVVDQVVKDFGSLDILVNNAGTLDHVAAIEKQQDALWDRDLKVNLTGAYNCSKAVWPHMRERQWGRIIMMASIAGTMGGFGQASYSTTKAGLIGLARTLALEGARYGITANAIVPGIIGTEAFKMGRADMNERMISRTAMRRAGEPDDIAAAITFLCSPEAGYITGVALPVMGGMDLFTF
ncbi:MAG TPA: SDR family oxidoreductase [Candidatus Eisenbacteria bacterium]|jgi:3-oxoacyl-[acyl-carrier protein] reductase|nr:SDR family oxidoreductase [Candidatus Eisenbacteria bacterium]